MNGRDFLRRIVELRRDAIIAYGSGGMRTAEKEFFAALDLAWEAAEDLSLSEVD